MTKPRAKSRVPRFRTVEEEAAFWNTHSTTEFEDEFETVSDVRFVVRQAGPKKAVTVRLDPETAADISRHARERGVRTSALARMWLEEHLREEERRALES